MVNLGDFEIYFYDLVDSTQDLARNLREAKEFTTIVAREQSRARGRFGRRWCSPVGGLWFTTILYPKTSISTYSILCLLSSLSVVEAIKDLTSIEAFIKWPNDVYVSGKKIAGILVESEVFGDIIERAIVGIGLNLNFRIDAIPGELRNKVTTLLEEYGKPVHTETLLLRILNELKKNYEKYKIGAYSELIEAIKSDMEILGREAVVSLSHGEILGVVRDLDIDGNLIFESSGGKIVIKPSEIKKLELV
ncbi:MAG: biotin--[acetyl-CoA-carboxylase] ligase [Nitrososphaerota archaeon]